MAASGDNAFLATTAEDASLNQYWYSPRTIAAMVSAVESCGRTAFLSTPSVYFSVPESHRAGDVLFDLDDQWAADPGYVRYDYRDPSAIPARLAGAFDLVVIDPPFITEDVWRLYARAVVILLRPGGRVLASTVFENEALMRELFDAAPQRFLPSIPHLVYQYRFYANFNADALAQSNPEVPEE